MSDQEETTPKPPAFDFQAFPGDTLFYDRREGLERRDQAHAPVGPRAVDPTPKPTPAGERRAKKERRRRIDPTTFEKQYTDDEMEFMTAMQRFKVQSGKMFPNHGEVLRVAFGLGYRKLVSEQQGPFEDDDMSPAEALETESVAVPSFVLPPLVFEP